MEIQHVIHIRLINIIKRFINTFLEPAHELACVGRALTMRTYSITDLFKPIEYRKKTKSIENVVREMIDEFIARFIKMYCELTNQITASPLVVRWTVRVNSITLRKASQQE